ncbi:MAG: putative toxin-antitoxin system toxin component, PIN family [Sphingobacterium sp.]
MPVKRKKVKRFVIDVNTLITIFITRKTDWLQTYVIQNALEIFIDNNLVEELARVLDYPKIKKWLPLNKRSYLTLVHSISTFVLAEGFDVQCPDPEDYYLYNLALYVNAKLLVSGEKALLEWQKSPVETISLSKFKELF